ncbi:MAG TPA: MFS transporter [Pseudonocardiaceae bacterium]|jgi:MFS family permease
MDQITTVRSAPPTSAPSSSTTLIAALVLAVVSCQLCISMPNPALPAIAGGLHTTTAVIGFAQAMFFLFGGILSVIMAAYSDHAKTRRLMALAMIVAVVGALVAAAAPSTAIFIVGRCLQSTSAAVFPLALRVLRQTLSARQFGKAMGIITAANGGIVGLDGLLSGWLSDHYGFRSVFIAMAVFGVIATLLLLRWVTELPSTAGGRMDWLGVALLSLGLAFVEFGIGSASSMPIGIVLGLIVLGIVLFGVFVLTQKRAAHPLIPVEYLRSRSSWPVLLSSALVTAGMLSTINFIIPVFSQNRHIGFGISATMSALLFIVPVCLINVIFAPLFGSLAPRVGWRRMLRVSMALTVPVLVILALGLTVEWVVVLMVALVGFGLAGAMTPLNGLSAILASPERPSVLPGVNSAAYGVGASLGVVLAAQLASVIPPSAAGYRDGIWLMAALIAVGFGVSMLISGRSDISGQKV